MVYNYCFLQVGIVLRCMCLGEYWDDRSHDSHKTPQDTCHTGQLSSLVFLKMLSWIPFLLLFLTPLGQVEPESEEKYILTLTDRILCPVRKLGSGSWSWAKPPTCLKQGGHHEMLSPGCSLAGKSPSWPEWKGQCSLVGIAQGLESNGPALSSLSTSF